MVTGSREMKSLPSYESNIFQGSWERQWQAAVERKGSPQTTRTHIGMNSNAHTHAQETDTHTSMHKKQKHADTFIRNRHTNAHWQRHTVTLTRNHWRMNLHMLHTHTFWYSNVTRMQIHACTYRNKHTHTNRCKQAHVLERTHLRTHTYTENIGDSDGAHNDVHKDACACKDTNTHTHSWLHTYTDADGHMFVSIHTDKNNDHRLTDTFGTSIQYIYTQFIQCIWEYARTSSCTWIMAHTAWTCFFGAKHCMCVAYLM